MRYQILLILLLCASLLTAINHQQFEENASGLRAQLSFERAVPSINEQIVDEDGFDNVSSFTTTYALPFESVGIRVNRIVWDVFDSSGNFLHQSSDRKSQDVVIANSFQFREMRGFTIKAPTRFSESGLEYRLSQLDYSLNGRGSILLPQSVSPAFVDAYKFLADNYDTSYLKGLPTARPKMLIISHPNMEIYQAAYINWKRSLGFDIDVVNRVDIGESVNDIKSYLITYYQQHQPDYLLLLGDVTGNYTIPTAFYPSPEYQENDADDFQYSLLDGDDYFPELLVGRFSFNEINEFRSMANKTIVHEKSPYMAEPEWMKRSLVVAGNYAEGQLRPTTPVHMSRWLRNKMLDKGYAQVDSVFYPPTYPGTSAIASSINNGVQFISYRGWGDVHGWHYPYFHKEDLDDVTSNQRMPIVFSIVCNTGDFANSTNPCFGEKWMRMGTVERPNGCVAFVGPSDLRTRTRLNNSISSGAFRSILDFGVRGFGTSVLMGKIELYKNFPNDIAPGQYVPFYFHVYNLLADPSLNMWMLEPNTISSSLLPSNYSTSASNITITAPHLEDAIVSGTKNSETYSYARIKDGVAVLPIDPEEGGTLTITISKPNYVPLVKRLRAEEDGGLGIIANTASDVFIDPNHGMDAIITLKNYGTETVELSSVVFECVDNISITGVNSAASIAAGATETITFHVDAAAGVQPREALTVNLLINDLDPKTFRLWGGGAEFTVVSDEGILEIGQSSTSQITVLNHSNTSLTDVSVQVLSLTEAATISDEFIHLGAVAAGETVSFDVSVAVGDRAWGGRSLPIRLNFVDNGYTTYCFYKLTAGVASNTSPTGPCSYGYYAYDSFDVDFAERPVYEWVEIDPKLGGHAEVFLHHDDASTTIDLPFTFRFYGKDYDEFTVCTNGWISLGDVDDVDFYNVYIPAALGPSPLIAPYWDDLKGQPDGEDEDGQPVFQKMRMLYWHDVANNRYIIQWNDAYNQYNLTSLEKFQIFLYPKDGEDGDIVFQYHTVDNPGITSNYCTVGIEDHTSTVGLTYTHANHYPPTATPLQAGLAIKFTTTPPDNYVSNDDLVQIPAVALEQNYPNPFNPSTTIRFNLDRGQKARLDIFNLRGQLVNTLVNENLERGAHSIVFDGTDSKGNPLASGLYLYRLQTQNQSISRKMLLIK
ncbi:MAG: C25 family cysteine peptidase [Candidatus Cloacimonadaceae bacterium]|jgi:hypothetical protein